MKIRFKLLTVMLTTVLILACIPMQVQAKQIIVAIDAGHQGKANKSKEPIGPGSKIKKAKVSAGTTGKYTKVKESVVTLQTAKKLQTELKKRGYKVVMIRSSQNVNISNAERAKKANNAKADIFVRIHCNGSTKTNISGALCVAPTTKNKFLSKSLINKSRSLSKAIVNGLCKATKAKNRGIQSSDTMTGINWCKMPVAIVEMGFMSNKAEDKKLVSSSYQTKLAKGIANGIDSYFKK